MKVSNVYFDENTFGITQRSLKLLRDTIALNCDRPLMVVEVPTDHLCCGFMIFVKKEYGIEVIWTGDGFRLDGGGEGGAGYRTAETILYLFGVKPFGWENWQSYEDLYTSTKEVIRKSIKEMAEQILETIGDGFTVPTTSNPPYIRR